MKGYQTEIIFSISMAVIVVSFCLTTSFLTRRVKQEQTSAKMAMAYQEVSIESLKNLCLGMIALNGNDEGKMYGELIKEYPQSYFNQNSIYVLCSKNGCSSCLTTLLEIIEGCSADIEDYYFLLEENNGFLLDEIKANGFNSSNASFFELLTFPEGENIILAKKRNDTLFMMGYEIHVDPAIVTHFINL